MVVYSGLKFLLTKAGRLSTSVATLAKFIIDIYVAIIFFYLNNLWFSFFLNSLAYITILKKQNFKFHRGKKLIGFFSKKLTKFCPLGQIFQRC